MVTITEFCGEICIEIYLESQNNVPVIFQNFMKKRFKYDIAMWPKLTKRANFMNLEDCNNGFKVHTNPNFVHLLTYVDTHYFPIFKVMAVFNLKLWIIEPSKLEDPFSQIRSHMAKLSEIFGHRILHGFILSDCLSVFVQYLNNWAQCVIGQNIFQQEKFNVLIF